METISRDVLAEHPPTPNLADRRIPVLPSQVATDSHAALRPDDRRFPATVSAGEVSPAPTASQDQPESVAKLPAGGFSVLLRRFVPPILGVWCAGFLILICRVGIRWHRLMRILGTSRPVACERIQAAFAQACRLMGVAAAPRLTISPHVVSPVAAGYWNAQVVLPDTILARITPDELEQILIHEMAHVVRRDPLVALLQNVVGAMFWLHPLVHVLNRQLAQAREEICDNYVLGVCDAPAYSRTLLMLAELTTATRSLAGAVGILAARWKLETRIAGILDERRNLTTRMTTRGKTLVVASSLCAAMIAAAGTISLVSPTVAVTAEHDRPSTGQPGAIHELAALPDPKSSSSPVLAQVAGDQVKPAAGPETVDKPAGDRSPLAKPTEPAGPRVTAMGTVVDLAGKPLAGVTVYLREWTQFAVPVNSQARDLLATTTTNERGEFTLQGIGTRELWSRPGLTDQVLCDVVAIASGFAVAGHHLQSTESPEPIRLMLAPDATVSGRVVDDQGQPLSNVAVSVEKISPLDSGPVGNLADPEALWLQFSQVAPRANTDASGRFQIAGLPRGRRFELRFENKQYVRQHVYAATTDVPQPDVVYPRPAGVKFRDDMPVHTGEFAVTLKPGRQIAGRVLLGGSGKPAAGARVSIHGKQLQATDADDDGRFTFAGLPEGDYRVIANSLASGSHLIREIGTTLSPEQQRREVELTLPLGTEVKGIVVDEDSGAGIPDVKVEDIAEGQTAQPPAKDRIASRSVQTDAHGRFRLVVPPGKRSVRLEGPVSGYVVPDRYGRTSTPLFSMGPRAHPELISQSIEVIDGQRPAELRFALGRGLTIEGVVRAPNGEGLADAEVRNTNGYSQTRSGQVTRTDAQGRFRLSGFFPGISQKFVIMDKARTLLGRVVVPPPAPGEMTKNRVVQVEVKLQPAARVAGRVLTDGSQPFPGVQVMLYAYEDNEDGNVFGRPTGVDAITDADGRFVLDPVESGLRYSAEVEMHGFERREFVNRFKVESGKTHECAPFTLRKLGYSVSGIVIDLDGNPVVGATILARDRETNQFFARASEESIVTGADGRFTVKHLPKASLSLMAYMRSPPGATDRAIRFPAYADAEAGQTDVRILLDPKLSQSKVKRAKSVP